MPSLFGFISRFSYLTVTIGAMWLCWSNAVERFTASSTQIARLAPFETGAHGLTSRAWYAYVRGDLAQARALGIASVAREPNDQRALRTLGFAELASGNATLGEMLMRRAGALGWRDGLTQLYWADVSRSVGDWAVAAQRLDAVMRTSGAASPEARAQLLAVEATPAGRKAIIDRLREPNLWGAVYLADLSALDSAALLGRIALVRSAARAGVAVDGSTFSAIEFALIEHGRSDLARALWQTADPARPAMGTLLGNGGFEDADEARRPSPFAWSFAAAQGLDTTIEGAPAPLTGRALHVKASTPMPTGLAEQLTRLEPGTYQLSLRIVGAHTASPVEATILCSNRMPVELVRTDTTAGTAFRFTIPGRAGCTTQRLALLLNSVEGQSDADLWIDDVSIVRR